MRGSPRPPLLKKYAWWGPSEPQAIGMHAQSALHTPLREWWLLITTPPAGAPLTEDVRDHSCSIVRRGGGAHTARGAEARGVQGVRLRWSGGAQREGHHHGKEGRGKGETPRGEIPRRAPRREDRDRAHEVGDPRRRIAEERPPPDLLQGRGGDSAQWDNRELPRAQEGARVQGTRLRERDGQRGHRPSHRGGVLEGEGPGRGGPGGREADEGAVRLRGALQGQARPPGRRKVRRPPRGGDGREDEVPCERRARVPPPHRPGRVP